MELGLTDPVLGFSQRTYLPRSILYNHSSNRFSKPLLTPSECTEDIMATRKQREHLALQNIIKCQNCSDCNFRNPIARWDTKFEPGAETALLHPFFPIVIAADEDERIRVWNYKEATLLNSFNNHEYPDKGISKLCLVNEFDESLILVASSDGNVRIWKDYICQDEQKLVTAFSAIHVHTPGARSVSAVVDWQQSSGYLYASGEISSTMVWDLHKEQLLSCIPLASDCSISALAASQVYGGQYAAGFVDGSVQLFDIRTPNGLVFVSQQHTPGVSTSDGTERVVGISFQPGLDPSKIVSASKAGIIKFLDIRKQSDAYIIVDAHRGSLTALAIHRHAPLIASGSANQVIKVFNLEGEQLSTISTTFLAQKTGPVSCLAFHPYQILLAAGDTDARVSIYADEISPTR